MPYTMNERERNENWYIVTTQLAPELVQVLRALSTGRWCPQPRVVHIQRPNAKAAPLTAPATAALVHTKPRGALGIAPEEPGFNVSELTGNPAELHSCTIAVIIGCSTRCIQ